MIEIKNLKKKYRTFQLNDVNFKFDSGNIVGLIGPNGAGKSTILKILAGLEDKSGGQITVNGKEITKLEDKFRIGYMSQNLDIYSEQNMSEIVSFTKNAYKNNWDFSLFNHYLKDVFKLADNQKIKELSTGMRVKFFLSLELAKKPECMLLDEVTAGLDPMIRDEVLDILLDLASKENIPILLSSHITEDLEKIGDKIIYIDNGNILLEDSAGNIRKRFYKVDEKILNGESESIRSCIKENGFKIHQYYVYDNNNIKLEKRLGSSAMLSDVLAFLRKEELND